MKKVMITILLMASSLQFAMASEVILATFHRTSDGVKCNLVAHMTDKMDVEKIRFNIYKEDGELDRAIKISLEELEEGKAVLKKMGAKVITLQSDNFSAHNGGTVNIRYLKKYKLIGKSKYDKFVVDVDREGDQWILSRDGKRFTELMAHVHSKGISEFTIVK